MFFHGNTELGTESGAGPAVAKPFFSKSRRIAGFSVVAAVLMLGGCSTSGGGADQDEAGTQNADQGSDAPGDFAVTLLGTGTPAADPERFGYANLVQAGDTTLLFDAGRSASVRLNQMGVSVGSIDATFITHFHSDHTNGLADVFTAGYLNGDIGGRETPMQLYGPQGVTELAENTRAAHESDIEIRMEDEGVPEDGTRIEPHESEPGTVFEQDGVTVTMFETHHGDAIDPSVGYRVDYNGKSVVFSGDVKNDEGVVDNSEEADLLVHSVGTAPDEMMEQDFVQRVLGHHISPQDAGRTFAQVEPGMAVYSHVVRLGDGQVSMADIVEDTRETYSGPLTVAEDLMQFRIRDGGVSILQADQ